MSLARINLLNIGLMLASLAVAMVVPFETFLLAYAVLGPLHYLTQISWLHDRQCFTQNKRDWWPLLGLAAAISALTLTAIAYPTPALVGWAHSLLLFSFGVGFTLALIKDNVLRGTALAAFAVVAFLMHGSPVTTIWFGIYLPTVIHVFVFTGAFVLYGALKQRSLTAHSSLLVFVACGATALFLDPGMLGYVATDYAHEAYAEFTPMHGFLAADLGFADAIASRTGAQPEAAQFYPFQDASEVFTDPLGVQIGRFIGFAYTYHYLNWFSKTSIIGWHEVGKARIAAIVVLWLASIGLYALDYVTGLRWLLFLSLLHVLLEFPLNHRTFAGIGSELLARVRPAKAANAG